MDWYRTLHCEKDHRHAFEEASQRSICGRFHRREVESRPAEGVANNTEKCYECNRVVSKKTEK